MNEKDDRKQSLIAKAYDLRSLSVAKSQHYHFKNTWAEIMILMRELEVPTLDFEWRFTKNISLQTGTIRLKTAQAVIEDDKYLYNAEKLSLDMLKEILKIK